ncbi:MAG TPA: EAL domain-containing protein [Telluria sp.]|jgi:diguanylate cyclase (GGDEF)-like protein
MQTVATAPFTRAAVAPPSLRAGHDRRLLCLAIGTAIVAIVITSVLTLAYLRRYAEERVAATTGNLAGSIVLTVDSIVDAIDLSLLATSDEIARQRASASVDARAVNRFMLRQQERLRVIPTLVATNARGDVIFGQLPVYPPLNVSERAYFPALAANAHRALYISEPVLGRLSQRWIWPFARRLELSDGRFGGVVTGALDTAQLSTVLAKIELQAGGSIVLRGGDFKAIAWRTGDAAALPLTVGDTYLSPELRQALQRNPARGTYTTSNSALSGASTTFSYERSSKYGFYVWVGESNQHAMAGWMRQVWIISGLTGAFIALSLGFLIVARQAARRRARDRHAIEQSHESLRDAQQIADIGSMRYAFASGRWTSSAMFDQLAGIGPDYPRDLAHLLLFLGRLERVAISRYLRSALQRRMPFDSKEFMIRRQDGQQRWVHARGKVCVDEAGAETMVCTVQDITERKRAQDEISRLAWFDELTGLPNRRLLLERLAAAMDAGNGQAAHGALLLIDLDHFKILNDTQGHERGDLLLKAVAQRLSGCMGGQERVARMGGDEFAVLAGDLPADAQAAHAQVAALAETVRAALSGNYEIDGAQYASSPSIGITLFCGHALSVDELVQRADTAMYQAKAAGRNTLRFFDPATQAAVAARLALEHDLRLALDEQQFLLHFQVQVDATARARGAEVLVRWQHPVRGMVSPGEFIPLAEASGLILPLGHWVLQCACVQLAAWGGDPETRQLSLAVNVSASQFSQPDFVAQVLAVLHQSGANPQRLKLELTEGMLLEHTDLVIDTISALKRAGIGISLDDFGTGYSSLSYLKRLPLNQLKIDQTFVRELPAASDMAIVRTIVALGQSLGMDVIAEGVETVAQRDALAAAGCHAYQGYLFGKPMPIAQFEAALRQTSRTAAALPLLETP